MARRPRRPRGAPKGAQQHKAPKGSQQHKPPKGGHKPPKGRRPPLPPGHQPQSIHANRKLLSRQATGMRPLIPDED